MKRAALATLLWLAAAGAQAQFKVLGPDGRVTYTDRPPPAAEGKAVPLRNGREVAAAPTSAPLPLPPTLREAASRFPVTLYSVNDCTPCDAGRQLLRGRGVPFAERAAGPADRDAWVRIVGSADAPALVIGRQWLRGYSPEEWHAILDTAGYPRQSQLPGSYVAPPPTPLVERAAPQPATAAAPPPPPEPPAEEAPGGIRF